MLLSVSCAVVSVPRSEIYYVDDQSQQKSIWQTITDENDRYRLSLTPLGNLDDALLFEVDFLNKSSEDMVIDPRLWTMQTSSSYASEYKAMENVDMMSSEEIATLYNQLADKMQSAKQQNDAVAFAIGAILVIGLIVVIADMQNAAAKAASNNGEVVTNNFQRPMVTPYISLGFQFNPYRSYTRMNTNDRIQFLRNEADRYSKSFIDAASVAPGEEINFNIFFPRVASMSDFKLSWQLDGKFLEWHFNQLINGMKIQNDVGVPSGVE